MSFPTAVVIFSLRTTTCIHCSCSSSSSVVARPPCNAPEERVRLYAGIAGEDRVYYDFVRSKLLWSDEFLSSTRLIGRTTSICAFGFSPCDIVLGGKSCKIRGHAWGQFISVGCKPALGHEAHANLSQGLVIFPRRFTLILTPPQWWGSDYFSGAQ